MIPVPDGPLRRQERDLPVAAAAVCLDFKFSFFPHCKCDTLCPLMEFVGTSQPSQDEDLSVYCASAGTSRQATANDDSDGDWDVAFVCSSQPLEDGEDEWSTARRLKIPTHTTSPPATPLARSQAIFELEPVAINVDGASGDDHGVIDGDMLARRARRARLVRRVPPAVRPKFMVELGIPFDGAFCSHRGRPRWHPLPPYRVLCVLSDASLWLRSWRGDGDGRATRHIAS
ncbi:hypothetical protein B0H17DRAFT_1105200 [Mycena rosella]|uniref:Uncharacterized protein n=1 Tax=Mycena rosella TaxID=1033263 RepID=A0AAD7C6X5_MYCRO|nr:hypothetical protein B0H17DRAFT_1105200 [Mycena rosella]